jgi:hypothetical protein
MNHSESLGLCTLSIIRNSKLLENTRFRKLDLFPSSGELREIAILLGPLESEVIILRGSPVPKDGRCCNVLIASAKWPADTSCSLSYMACRYIYLHQLQNVADTSNSLSYRTLQTHLSQLQDDADTSIRISYRTLQTHLSQLQDVADTSFSATGRCRYIYPHQLQDVADTSNSLS